MIAVLSGGTGTPKLLQGLKRVLDESEISVIVNTADDCWLDHGYFSPDIDTVMYTMSDQINERTWYGIKGDTFHAHKQLAKLGHREFLKIGDRDRATHIQRGALLKAGKKLSDAVEIQKARFKIRAGIFPMSDDPVKTVIKTNRGDMGLEEFWVEKKGMPEVKDVYFAGIEKAKPCDEALNAIENADGVIIGPSNPISSILPIISLKGMKKKIQKKKCTAISPIIANKPVSGPAEKFMLARGMKVSSASVAELYKDIIDSFIIDAADKCTLNRIKCIKTNIIMSKLSNKINLAKITLNALDII